MCRIEDKYIAPEFPPKCRRRSLASEIALFLQKPCLSINSKDISTAKEILHLALTCQNSSCPFKPQKIREVKGLLDKYTDLNFTESCKKGSCFLNYAKMDLEDEADWHFFVKTFEGKQLEENGVKVIAVYIGNSKYDLFEHYLIQDVRYFIVAMALVLVVMLGYLKSLALMLATVLNVGFSYMAAYLFYYFVFRQTFFPFMNLLALLVLIAVGADDVFIFYDSWLQAKKELPHGTYEHWIAKTFNHAVVSVTVTSFTTAGAFFSNIISSIIAIKCFGLFAGTCIMTNLLFMLTWTPAVIVMVEKVWDWILKRLPHISLAWNTLCECCHKASSAVYDKYIPLIIEKGRFVWVLLFLGVGGAGFVVIFYKPGLKLPQSQDFQLFPDNMKLEKWDRDVKFQFKTGPSWKIPIVFTWGVKCKDNRNAMDPDDQGSQDLEYDDKFDFFSEKSQIAMKKFINNARRYKYFDQTNMKLPSVWDFIISEQKQMCTSNYSISVIGKECCENILKFPVPKKLDHCIKKFLATPYYSSAPVLNYPLFNDQGQAKVLIFQADTTFPFSLSYEEMHEHYQSLQQFYKEQMKYMPTEMNSMCFSGGHVYTYQFYDLQLAIGTGTMWSIGFSLAIASVILFLSSLNLILTLYAIFTITLAISATVATIVLMGWELNILESIAVSMAAGLSVDFTIHYSVAYKLSKEVTPRLRVREGFHRVGFAVAVAALTTFLAGSAVMPSHIIAYTKLGIFLMLVMSFSWVYSTFFFQSLCCIIGPKGNFCQLPSPTRICKKKKVRNFTGYEQTNHVIYDDDDTLLEPM